MDTQSHQSCPSTSVEEFIANYPKVKFGRAALDKLQADYSSGDTFTIVDKPFTNMVLHQEFDADTKKRLYVVALVDDQKALDDYAEASDEAAGENSKCDCAEHQGPDHLIFDHIRKYKKADCSEHIGAGEPDPACSACWPVLCGANCSP